MRCVLWRCWYLTMDKEQLAIARLREASEMSLYVYNKPLLVTISGGKDSSVCIELALRAGIPFEVLHSHTTADAPGTVRFVRRELHRLELMGIKCKVEIPVYKGVRTSMWDLIPKKLIPPTRRTRYCCEVLKENGGKNCFIATGVRWAESSDRESTRGIYEKTHRDISKRIIINNDNGYFRRVTESCGAKGKLVCNPIVDWTDADVWNYIDIHGIPINPLYVRGFSRVGCVGCPLAGNKRTFEFGRYPKYKQLYIMAFERMLQERERKGRPTMWESADEVFHWWMEDGVLPGQESLFAEEDL